MKINVDPVMLQTLLNYLETRPHREVRDFIDSLVTAVRVAQEVTEGAHSPPPPPAPIVRAPIVPAPQEKPAGKEKTV
jgi:hypothetical protein